MTLEIVRIAHTARLEISTSLGIERQDSYRSAEA